MKKVLIHVGFALGIATYSALGVAGYTGGVYGHNFISFSMLFCAGVLSYAYILYIGKNKQPPADRVKSANSLPDLSALHVNPAKPAEGFFWLTDEPTTTIDPEIEKRYRQTIKNRVAATTPLPDVFDLSEMD